MNPAHLWWECTRPLKRTSVTVQWIDASHRCLAGHGLTCARQSGEDGAPAQAPPPASSRRSSLPSPHRPGSGSREASPRKREVEVDQEENLVERRAGLGEGGPSATLGRRRSRIPQPRHQGGGRLGRWETNGYYFQALENFVLSGQQVSLILAPTVWMRD